MLHRLRDELNQAHLSTEKERSEKQAAKEELREAKLNLDAKEQVCVTIKGQVDNLVKELEHIQNNVLKKEKSKQDRLAQAKGKLQAEIKERKNVEARLKDNQSALVQRQEEILSLQRGMAEKENEKRKLKAELDKVRK